MEENKGETHEPPIPSPLRLQPPRARRSIRRLLLLSGALIAFLGAKVILDPGWFGMRPVEALYRSRLQVRSGAPLSYYLESARTIGVSAGGFDLRSAALKADPVAMPAALPAAPELGERVFLPLALTALKGVFESPGYQIAGAGNIAGCETRGDEQTAALLEGFSGTVITLGDNVIDHGTLGEYIDCYSVSWGRFNSSVRPAPGNREYSSGDASGYYDYFGERAGAAGEGWYSYNLGTWHILSLNSMCGRTNYCNPNSEQLRWLEADLADHAGLCTLAYWHHPHFSSSEDGGSSQLATIWQLLYRYGVEAVLTGHDAFYERFEGQDPFGNPDPERGIVQINAGTGGMKTEVFGAPQPNSAVRITGILGVIRLRLAPGYFEWGFVAAPSGVVLDAGEAVCH